MSLGGALRRKCNTIDELQSILPQAPLILSGRLAGHRRMAPAVDATRIALFP
jgi:hypothetical protein